MIYMKKMVAKTLIRRCDTLEIAVNVIFGILFLVGAKTFYSLWLEVKKNKNDASFETVMMTKLFFYFYPLLILVFIISGIKNIVSIFL